MSNLVSCHTALPHTACTHQCCQRYKCPPDRSTPLLTSTQLDTRSQQRTTPCSSTTPWPLCCQNAHCYTAHCTPPSLDPSRYRTDQRHTQCKQLHYQCCNDQLRTSLVSPFPQHMSTRLGTRQCSSPSSCQLHCRSTQQHTHRCRLSSTYPWHCRTYRWDSCCTLPHQPMSTDRQGTAAQWRSPTPRHKRTPLDTAPSKTTSSNPLCHQSCPPHTGHCTVVTPDQTCCRTGRSGTGHCMRLCPAQPPHRTVPHCSCCTTTTRPRCTDLADTLPLSH